MKIISLIKPTEIDFVLLKGGDVFEWTGEYYVKTAGEEAVRLDDGTLDNFPANFKVRPVEATLTIS